MTNRRNVLSLISGAAVVAFYGPARLLSVEPAAKRTGLGLVTYCCRLHQLLQRQHDPKSNLFEPFTFFEHCRDLGAGGMQLSLQALDSTQAPRLRKQAEDAGMFVEAIISVPRVKKDLEQFDAQMRIAVLAGAQAVRTTIIPGRRYEYFDSLEKFREYDARGRKSLELATPIAEKHRLPLAVENHKDHRNNERVALFEHISSEFVGACVDTGNSIALLEDAVETVEALAPWAHCVHLKDQAVQLYEDGFLLGDIPLGQGFLDLKKIVAILRQHKPNIHFSLELITRDPLQVPCLTDEYWATFPDVPGTDLARTLRAVRAGAAPRLQQIGSLSLADQVAREHKNVRASLDYARDHLGL